MRDRSAKASIQTKLVLPGTNRDSLLVPMFLCLKMCKKTAEPPAAMQKGGKKQREKEFLYDIFHFILERLLICNRKKKKQKKKFKAALGEDIDIILYHMLFGKRSFIIV